MTEIQHRFKIWYQQYVKGQTFEKSLFPVGVVSKISQFWGFYQHMKRPNELDEGSYIYFFKEIIKPTWEDPHNEKGGEYVLKFEKDKCNQVWEDILLELIQSSEEQLKGINGVRIKIRKDKAAEIDLWVQDVKNNEQLQRQRNWLLKAARLNIQTPLEFLPFNN